MRRGSQGSKQQAEDLLHVWLGDGGLQFSLGTGNLTSYSYTFLSVSLHFMSLSPSLSLLILSASSVSLAISLPLSHSLLPTFLSLSFSTSLSVLISLRDTVHAPGNSRGWVDTGLLG